MPENGFSLINVNGLSNVAIKLLDMLEKSVGWAVSPKGSRNDFEEAIKYYKKSIEEDTSIPPLVKASKIAAARKELTQYFNHGNIISNTIAYLKQDSKIDNVDFNWLVRFFEAAGCVSDNDIQDLWAKVLTGTLQQGNFSFRALETLQNMSKQEAIIFQKLLKYITFSNSTYFLFSYGFSGFSSNYSEAINPIKSEGLTFADDVFLMQECGILTNYPMGVHGDDPSFEIRNQRIIGVVTPKTKHSKKHILEGYVLTSVGTQLFNSIVANEPSVSFAPVLADDGKSFQNMGDLYFYLCLKKLKANKGLDVKAYILKKPYDITHPNNERICFPNDILLTLE